MDAIGAFIGNLHQTLGHDKTAAYLGQPPGDRAEYLLCAYEQQPDDEHRAAVVTAIGNTRSDMITAELPTDGVS